MIIKSFKYAFILILSSSIIACQSNASEAEVKEVSNENDVVSENDAAPQSEEQETDFQFNSSFALYKLV